MRASIAAFFALASMLAQDSISRQMVSVARQRRAAMGPGTSLARQQLAAARQRSAARRTYREEPWIVSPAPQWASNDIFQTFQPPPCPSLNWQQARDRFEEEEKRNALPTGLLEAVAVQESGLYPCAVSSAGATGLMQLMPSTAASFGVADPLDPWQSLQGGGQFLRQLLDRYGGDLRLALGAYNAGPARVDYFGGVPPFPETQNYVESIMLRLNREAAARDPKSP